MGKFVIKKTPTGAFNFSLYAANMEKIAVSSQVYTTKSACKKGMESIGKNAAKCIAEDKVEDQTLKKPTERPARNLKSTLTKQVCTVTA